MTPGFGRLHPGELSDESAEEFLITEMVPGGGEYNHPPIVRGSAKQPLPGRSNPWKPHRASGLSFTVHVVTSRRGFSFSFLFFYSSIRGRSLRLCCHLSVVLGTAHDCFLLHCSRAQQNWQVGAGFRPGGLLSRCAGVTGEAVSVACSLRSLVIMLITSTFSHTLALV